MNDDKKDERNDIRKRDDAVTAVLPAPAVPLVIDIPTAASKPPLIRLRAETTVSAAGLAGW
jgi:hypothetical protein